MEKELKVRGPNGEFIGKVTILFNYKSETKQVHNRSTHDEGQRRFSYHVVKGETPNEGWTSGDLTNESETVPAAQEMEQTVLAGLKRLAFEEVKPSTIDTLTAMGFH